MWIGCGLTETFDTITTPSELILIAIKGRFSMFEGRLNFPKAETFIPNKELNLLNGESIIMDDMSNLTYNSFTD